MGAGVYKLSGKPREVALTFSQGWNGRELVIRIFVSAARPVEKNKRLVVFDDMRNVERRTHSYAETVLIVLWLLLGPAKHIRAMVQRVGSRIENGIVGTVEDAPMRLIDVKSAHSSTEREDSWSTTKATSSACSSTTKNDWTSTAP